MITKSQRQNIFTIAKKEFLAFFNTPVAYVIGVPFLVLNAFLFIRSAFVMGDANLRPMIELMPWFFMILGPAIAMKAYSDEKRQSTLELLFAHPVNEWVIAAGKLVGLSAVMLVFLLATLPIPITLMLIAKPDIGVMFGQYLGSAFVSVVFVAIGVVSSALTGSAIAGFLTGAAINFILIIMGMSFVTLLIPGIFSRLMTEVAIMTHLTSVAQGVVDVRDIIYFSSLVLITLILTVKELSKRRLAELPKEAFRLNQLLTLTVILTLVINVVLYDFPIRLDLTADHRFSISKGAAILIKNLDDRLTVNFYYSNNLPGPMQTTLSAVTDYLKIISRLSSKIVVKLINTDAKIENKTEALNKGIREVQFNQIGSSSFNVQTGMMGLEIRLGDKSEVVDYVEDASNIEYSLSRLIAKLSKKELPKIGLMNESAESSAEIANLLSNQYQISYFSNSSKLEDLQKVNGLLLIDDGTNENATISALIKNYVSVGGNVMILADKYNVSVQSLRPVMSKSKIIDTLSAWGISYKDGLAYDPQMAEAVTMGSGNVRYMIPYPYWFHALTKPTELNMPSGLTSIMLGWPGSLTVNPVGYSATNLVVTNSKSGGFMDKPISVDPQETLSQAKPNGEQILGTLLTKDKQKLIVIADSNLVSDDFLKNSPENQQFITNVLDQISNDPIFSQIPKRGSTRTIFTIGSPIELVLAQWGNVIIPSLVFALFGVYRLFKRKQGYKRTYHFS